MADTYIERNKRIEELHKLELLRNSLSLALDLDIDRIQWQTEAKEPTIMILGSVPHLLKLWDIELRKQGLLTIDDFYKRDGVQNVR